MAEALAITGIVSSIVQLVDASFKVIDRINDFRCSLGEVPEAFQHLHNELPLFTETFRKVKQTLEARPAIDEPSRKALEPIITACKAEVDGLSHILQRTIPAKDASQKQRGWKALLSLAKDKDVHKSVKILRGYVSNLTFYYVVSAYGRPATDEKLAAIRGWLAAPDPSINYAKALEQRQRDTGRWFLESQDFRKWKSEASSFLWLHGRPGCGKTILSSSILEDLLRTMQTKLGQVVTYFYFDFKESRRQDPGAMVKSLISQFAHHSASVPSNLEALYDSCVKGLHQPTLDELMNVLKGMVAPEDPRQGFVEAYIVLDALDECDSRAELLRVIETIANWRLGSFRVLVTSRDETDIRRCIESILREENSINLQSKVIDDDIRKFVQEQLASDPTLRKWSKHKGLIEDAMLKKADGMKGNPCFRFRWAACQLDSIRQCRNYAQLKRCLDDLPPTLDETYARILGSIRPQDRDYALRILRLAEVVAIDPDRDSAFDPEEVLSDPMDVLDICAGLVTVVNTPFINGRDTVGFAHYSVKEYLVSGRLQPEMNADFYHLNPEICHAFIASCCLHRLLHLENAWGARSEPRALTLPNTDGYSTTPTEESSRLLLVTALDWLKHYQHSGGHTAQIGSLIKRMAIEPHGAYLHWYRLLRCWNRYNAFDSSSTSKAILRLLENGASLCNWKKTANWKETASHIPDPLYVAALAGLTDLTTELLKRNDCSINRAAGDLGTPLQAASYSGNIVGVKQLVQAGADINIRSRRYPTALQIAASAGHTDIVIYLLQAGADPNLASGTFIAPLQAAASCGEAISGGLVFPNIQRWLGRTVFPSSQPSHVYERIVRHLIDAGADVNVPDVYRVGQRNDEETPPLFFATAAGSMNIVQQLLDAGAKVEGAAEDSLREAIEGNRLEILQLLVDRGANVNARTIVQGNEDTP